MSSNILNDDAEFIKYQLNHYFKNYNNTSNNFSYIDAVNDYISHANIAKNFNFIWIEVIYNNSINIYFIEGTNIENIMSTKATLLEYYNSEIIKDQTKLICSSINKFPFFIIRSGWDIPFININHPCLLRTSRRTINDYGVLIPDSSTQKLKILYNLKKEFTNIIFREKNNQLVWRGTFTGLFSQENSKYLEFKLNDNSTKKYKYYSRSHFVNTFHNKYDVKFYITNTESMETREMTIPKEASNTSFLDTSSMAKNYKFQIALNGNSFAGSFGWNLLSNSVVFHPKYEDNFYTYIIPRENVDYIPINDNYDDLDSKIKYYTENTDEAETIAKNGKKYIEQLLKLSPILTKKTMNKIHSLYKQDTLNEAVNLMNQKLTKISVKLKNNKFEII